MRMYLSMHMSTYMVYVRSMYNIYMYNIYMRMCDMYMYLSMVMSTYPHLFEPTGMRQRSASTTTSRF